MNPTATATAHLGANVQRLREHSNLTREQLAEASGTSIPTVWRIEARGHVPTTRVLAALADALAVSTSDLLAVPPGGEMPAAPIPTRAAGSL